MLKSTSKASLRSFASSYADGPPFCKERLSFADGCIVFGAQICPKTTTADGGRPLSPTGHRHRVGLFDRRTQARLPAYYDDVRDAESVAALSDIDAFESRFPTLPGDAEEREEVAVLNRTAALRKLVPLLDTNEDGYIDRSEMQRAMPAMPDDDLTRTMHECDLDGDGKVECEEWVQYVLRKQAHCDDAAFVEGVHKLCICLEAPFRESVAVAFAAADLDGSGELDLFEACRVLGDKAITKGIKFDECIERFDTSKDGVIDAVEFEALYRMMIEEGLLPRPRHPR